MRTLPPLPMTTLLVTTAVGVDLLAWNGDVVTAAGPALPSWAPVLATIAVHQSLWWRRSRAAPVFAGQAAFALVSLGVPLWQPVAGLLVATYAAGARGLRVTPVALALATVALGHGWGVARSASAPLPALLTVAVLTGLLAGIGYAAGRRQWGAGRRAMAAHAAYQQAVEDTRRAALEDERLRIARELHDGVAGSVTTLLLQAAGARAVAGDVAPTTGVTLAAIEDQAGRTLDELRRVVDGLRPGAGPGDDPLARVPDVVAAARAAGLTVRWAEIGDRAPLTQEAAHTVLRTVQEGLTNALKHGGPTSRCRVELDWGATQLRLELVTELDPGAAAAGLAAGGGVGLPSLADRARQAGGSMQHRLSGGAHLVSLRVPVAAAVAGAGCLAPVQ